MRAIFISYRRGDSEGESGRLFDDLVGRFGERAVFMDVAAIAPGRDFRKAIDESVAACGALLAMIGPTWSSIANDRGMRRLDDPADFVRLEIANALKRDIPVIPVLVRGAKMPRIEDLPDDLKELVYRNAVEISHARWKMDVGVLAEALRDLPGIAREPEPAPAPTVAVPSETVARQAALAPEALHGVAHELARYIGPIADVVVKHAARRSATIAELYDAVAREIEKPHDREAFLALKPR
jgi:hypothetical protein